MTLRYATLLPDGELKDEAQIDESICDCCSTDALRLDDGATLVAYRDRTASEIRDISVARLEQSTWSAPRTVHADHFSQVGAAAVDFLLYSGYVVLAFCWGRTALAAQEKLADKAADADAEAEFLSGKLATARFFFVRLLPRCAAHKAAVESGAGALMDVSAAALSSV